MFCQQCGLKLPEGAKFCSVCGTPVVQEQNNVAYQNNVNYPNNNVTQWKSDFERAKTTEQIKQRKKSQKKVLSIIIACVAVFAVLLITLGIVFFNTFSSVDARNAIVRAASDSYYGTSVVNIEKQDDGTYQGNIAVDYTCSLYKCSGSLIVRATKASNTWETTIVEDNVRFSLEPNNNYYYVSTKFAGNQSYIVRFKEISSSNITIEYFGHDLGTYGQDRYDSGEQTCTLNYNPETKNLEFEFGGYWRITNGSVEYNRYEIKRYDGEKFTVLEPIDPYEYWWFKKAKDNGIY